MESCDKPITVIIIIDPNVTYIPNNTNRKQPRSVNWASSVAQVLLGIIGLLFGVRLFVPAALHQLPFLLVGYGFGASFVALFAQPPGERWNGGVQRSEVRDWVIR